jgi:hypothetical protein
MTFQLPPFADPAHVNRRLHQVSLYLVAWETLRSAVLDRVKGFFTDRWTRDESGEMVGQPSPEYKEKVLSKHPKDEFHAACLWLRENNAFEDEDIEIIALARKHRNEIAHRIVDFIATGDREISRDALHGIYGIVKKHDIWWLTEVDMATQEGWTEDDYMAAREGKATGGYSMLLELILPIFDGNFDNLLDLQNAYKKHVEQGGALNTHPPGA